MLNSFKFSVAIAKKFGSTSIPTTFLAYLASTLVYFPFENGDASVIIENQRAAKIRFKNLSPSYKEGLEELAIQIVPDIKANIIKKIIKNI